jgi:Ca2+/Na+ antiporter
MMCVVFIHLHFLSLIGLVSGFHRGNPLCIIIIIYIYIIIIIYIYIIMKNSKSRNSARNKYSRKYNKKNSTFTRRITTGGKSGSNLASVLLSDLDKMADKSVNRKGSPNKTAVDDLMKIEKDIGDEKGSPADGKAVEEVIDDGTDDLVNDSKKIEDKIKHFTNNLSKLPQKEIISAFDSILKKAETDVSSMEKKSKEIESELIGGDVETNKIVRESFKKQSTLFSRSLDYFKEIRSKMSGTLIELNPKFHTKSAYLLTIFGYLINIMYLISIISLFYTVRESTYMFHFSQPGRTIHESETTNNFVFNKLKDLIYGKAPEYIIPPHLRYRGDYFFYQMYAPLTERVIHDIIYFTYAVKLLSGMALRGISRKIFGKVNKDVKKDVKK